MTNPVIDENDPIESLLNRLTSGDPLLKPYIDICRRRLQHTRDMENNITGGRLDLTEFAAGHEYYGLHLDGDQWVFREWAPNASGICLIGDMTGWREETAFALKRIDTGGDWEIRLPAEVMPHGTLYRLKMHWGKDSADRIPAYVRRVVQDPETLIFNAQVWLPEEEYEWRYPDFECPDEAPLIYETHVGMAQEEGTVGSYREFVRNILPRIAAAGYNTIQLMALQEHPYYGSFGYHVSNFFAASSRFGTPEDLKALIDEAHGMGLAVIMDLVHSHAAGNEVEGLACFDGTPYQYFHEGARGIHEHWDSRCFDYSKPNVLHFLLSNCRYWLDEYHVDGFRFDGVTSMLYEHHGIGRAFTSYDDYFDSSVDEDAFAYLTLANKLIHAVRPDAVTIAEDVSGMPGLASPLSGGGIGFDYRFAMGVPDFWIRLLKEYRDEDWPVGHMWYELTNRRQDEKTISYAEAHDQALVGDQTIIFRLIGADMYWHMGLHDQTIRVDRGIALHKMIRLMTLTTAGNGYLNFMGNEFGHPEWIDFPRQENNWSHHYARRQWHLLDDRNLKYQFLARFDRDMIAMVRRHRMFETGELRMLHEHEADKVMVFRRGSLLMAFNFHPTRSHVDYRVKVGAGQCRMLLDSDARRYGGHGRLSAHQTHVALEDEMDPGRHELRLYLPTRTALVFLWKPDMEDTPEA
jgi:1,4-alpha-glucan branching enzyme